MTKLDKLEEEVRGLDRKELAVFRNWFQDYDAEEWDRQIEMDIVSGRMEALAEKALREHKAGKTREI
jgi:hypothetical protein